MVKFTASLLIAALLAAPTAFAAVNSDTTFESRSLDELEHDLVARDIQEIWERFPHEELSEVEMRELEELVERSKIGKKIGNFFKHAFKFVKKVASFVIRREDADEEIMARDFEELDTRDLEEFFDRYINELEERSPHHAGLVKEIVHHAKKIAAHEAISGAASELESREFFDDEEELLERDFEEYDELD